MWEVEQRRLSARFAPAKVSRPDHLVFDRPGRRLALTNTLNGPIEILITTEGVRLHRSRAADARGGPGRQSRYLSTLSTISFGLP